MKNQPTRRKFLKASAAFGALTILPSWAAYGGQSSAGLPPSERIHLAVIGIGNQGHTDMNRLMQTDLCHLVAICDVDLNGEHVQKSFAKYPNVPRFQDFRKMFDRMADSIDAVLIATPDHSHFCATMLAMSLGKHVFVEKPLAHTYGQTVRLMAMEQKTGLVTQVGNQGFSGANYHQFKAWSEAGIIKDITRIDAHMTKAYPRPMEFDTRELREEPKPDGLDWDQWIDSAQESPYSERLHPKKWRGWYRYGSGALGDWGPHLLDTCHHFLDLGLPERITALERNGMAPLHPIFPKTSTIRFHFPARGERPKCIVNWYDGQGNLPMIDIPGAGGPQPLESDKPGRILYSDDLVFQGDSHGSVLRILPQETMREMREQLPHFPQRLSNHYANFLLAIKGEEAVRSPFSIAGSLDKVFRLGILSQLFGGELTFDSEKEQIIGHPQAHALTDPAPRRGWEEFYKMHL